MDDEATKQDAGVLGAPESVAGQEALATAPETKAPPVAPERDYAALQQEVTELKARLQTLSPDAIAQQVIRHPSLKTSQKQMIEFQVKQQMEAEIAKRTAALEQLEEQVTDPDALAQIAKQRKQIVQDVKEQFAKQPPPELQDLEREPTQPPIDTQRAAQALLVNAGLNWADVVPELQAAQPSGGMPFEQFAALVQQKAVAKRITTEKAQWVQEYEAATKQGRAADQGGAGKAPPAGEPTDKVQTLKKKFRHSGNVGEYARQRFTD